MSTRLYLVRHGATRATAEERFAGATDVELSPEGHEQAACLARRLSGVPFAGVYASTLRRAVDTAEPIAAPHGLSVTRLTALREIDHGRWEGLSREEVVRNFPDEHAAWEADPFTVAPVGGEPGLGVLARAVPAIHELVAAHPGVNVAVVSHKGTIRLLICALVGIDPRRYRDRLEVTPASLSILEWGAPGRARLTLLNDTAHLG